MASLESSVCYSYLDTAGTANVPVPEIRLIEACPPYQKHAFPAKPAAKPRSFNVCFLHCMVQIAQFQTPATRYRPNPENACLRSSRTAGSRRRNPGTFRQTRARLAAGNETAFPLPLRQSCHATSIGAATAIDE